MAAASISVSSLAVRLTVFYVFFIKLNDDGER